MSSLPGASVWMLAVGFGSVVLAPAVVITANSWHRGEVKGPVNPPWTTTPDDPTLKMIVSPDAQQMALRVERTLVARLMDPKHDKGEEELARLVVHSLVPPSADNRTETNK